MDPSSDPFVLVVRTDHHLMIGRRNVVYFTSCVSCKLLTIYIVVRRHLFTKTHKPTNNPFRRHLVAHQQGAARWWRGAILLGVGGYKHRHTAGPGHPYPRVGWTGPGPQAPLGRLLGGSAPRRGSVNNYIPEDQAYAYNGLTAVFGRAPQNPILHALCVMGIVGDPSPNSLRPLTGADPNLLRIYTGLFDLICLWFPAFWCNSGVLRWVGHHRPHQRTPRPLSFRDGLEDRVNQK
jgi:hypothetical protein